MRPAFHVLGSGCYTPGRTKGRRSAPVRDPAGYALEAGEQVLLFDLGFGNVRQMVRAGLEPERVSHVFISHRHPDHVGDLAALLFYFRCDGRPRTGRARLYGPRGFSSFMDRLAKAYHPWLRPRGYKLEIQELEEGGVVRAGRWKVSCREVPHTTESLAYRFDSPECSICYTGDTAWDPGLARFAEKADLLTVECALPDGERKPGHLRVSEALELGRLSGAKKVLLTHLSADSEKGLSRRISKDKRFVVAEDLMRIRL